MELHIINGPNINLLGKREKDIYGNISFGAFLSSLQERFKPAAIRAFQSNIEGEIVDRLHEVGFSCQGIVLNAGGYTHTSVAIHDAIAAIRVSVIEVHISNIYAREEFRHKNIISASCLGTIAGFGLESYAIALQHFVQPSVYGM